MRIATIALVITAAAAPVFASRDCKHQASRQAAVGAAGVRRVVIDAEAGSLRVEGKAGALEVRASGLACAPAAALLSQTTLTATRHGNEIRVTANTPDRFGFMNWGSGPRLDVTVTVPQNAQIVVKDSSGSIEIQNVGALDVEDGSGSLAVKGVAGNVHIRDGSGGMRLSDIAGIAQIDDGSGGIEIERAAGVVIEEDGSGSIEIRDVSGSVTIREDGSGSIDVRGVAGDFIVERDGSGGIDHERVRGRVRIPRRG